MATKELTADDFEKLLFQEFHVLRPSCAEQETTDACDVAAPDGGDDDEEGADLELIEVDRHHRIRHLEGGEFHKERKRAPFTLLFRGSHRHVYASHIHTLANEKFGALEVFLNPIHADPVHKLEAHPQGRFYEVYFN